MKQIILPMFLASGTLALTSCSSTSSTPSPVGEKTTSSSYQEGVPGGIMVETYTLSATVAALDVASRQVTLATPDGRRKTVKCGPEIINFNQIHVGDRVQAMVTSELALALADANAQPMGASHAQVVLAPKGAKPGGILTETQEYIATVTAINLRRREATLRLPDDTTRTFLVRKDVDLSQRRVGEKVAVRVTVAMALSVEKP